MGITERLAGLVIHNFIWGALHSQERSLRGLDQRGLSEFDGIKVPLTGLAKKAQTYFKASLQG